MVELEHIMYIGDDKPSASGSSTQARSLSAAATPPHVLLEADLKSLTRRQLQAKAKEYGVKVRKCTNCFALLQCPLATDPRVTSAFVYIHVLNIVSTLAGKSEVSDHH